MQTLPTLADSERTLLVDLEAIIDKGQQTFVEVGNALTLIRDERLYRASHATFEDYCQERWGFSKRRANQLIVATGIAKDLGTSGSTLNERQVRELAKVPEGKQKEVLQAATDKAVSENRTVTAQDIRDQISPPPPNPSGGGEVASAPSAALSRTYSLGAFQEETEGLVDIAVAEFDKDECSKAAGQLEMLAAKLRRRARVLTLEQNPHLKAA